MQEGTAIDISGIWRIDSVANVLSDSSEVSILHRGDDVVVVHRAASDLASPTLECAPEKWSVSPIRRRGDATERPSRRCGVSVEIRDQRTDRGRDLWVSTFPPSACLTLLPSQICL
jgi:hypothetical protein